jgi:hypothetical protein
MQLEESVVLNPAVLANPARVARAITRPKNTFYVTKATVTTTCSILLNGAQSSIMIFSITCRNVVSYSLLIKS